MQTVPDMIASRAAEQPQQVYLVFQDSEFTYSQMDRRSLQVARGLYDLGVRQGQRVALLVANSPDFLFIWWGILRLGAVMVPINLRLTGKECAYIINHSEARTVFLDRESQGMESELRKTCNRVVDWISLGGTGGDHRVESFYKGVSDPVAVTLSPQDPAVILYTSGTTGFPKGVVHTHASYMTTARSFALSACLKPEDRLLTANPLFHVNAQFYSCLGTLVAGATFILAEKFSASRMWAWTRKYRANKVVMLLALTTILYNRPPAPDDADNPVELVVAGGAPPGCYHAFEERFGLRLQTLYSLTEAPLAIMSPPGRACVDGAVGLPMVTPDGVDNTVRIVDDRLEDVPRGNAGEIVIRNPAVMKTYLKDPAATDQALVNGWLRTGDRGVTNDNGWIRFLGRDKDVIRKKGENISAVQVEQVITMHPTVAETAVIGVRPEDAAGEEEVMAFVLAEKDKPLNWGELITHSEKHLAGFKVPRFWKRVTKLPKNAMNRVVKAQLTEGSPPEESQGTFDRERSIR